MTPEPVGSTPSEKMDAGQTLNALILSDDPFDRAWGQGVAAMIQIRLQKRNDYTGNDSDQLSNYRASGYLIAKALGVEVTPSKAALVSMLARNQEKLTRTVTLLSGVRRMVEDETLPQTYLDVANISLLGFAELMTTEETL